MTGSRTTPCTLATAAVVGGWGVVLAGPVAILAGDQWRVAWVAFVVLAVVAGMGQQDSRRRAMT